MSKRKIEAEPHCYSAAPAKKVAASTRSNNTVASTSQLPSTRANVSFASIFAKPSDRFPPLTNNPLKFGTKVDGTVKIATWNVNGLQSAGSQAKNYAFRKYIEADQPDIIVLCEVKWPTAATDPQLEWSKVLYPYRIWAGQVAVLSKLKPISDAVIGFPGFADAANAEANERCITLEFDNVFIVGTYVPNAGPDKSKLERKRCWNRGFRQLIERLQEKKPVIWTGDFNVIIDGKDLESRSMNWDRRPGCFSEERDDHTALLASTDLVDFWRLTHPQAREFTHASIRFLGWRLDGFLVSRSILHRLRKTEIRHEVRKHFESASDHWPVVLEMEGPL